MKEEGFNLNFTDKETITITYRENIEENITFDKDTIDKIETLAEYRKVSIMKFFSDTLEREMSKKIGLYIQKALKEVLEEQYSYMEENKKRNQKNH